MWHALGRPVLGAATVPPRQRPASQNPTVSFYVSRTRADARPRCQDDKAVALPKANLWRLILLAAVANVSGLLFGYDASSINDVRAAAARRAAFVSPGVLTRGTQALPIITKEFGLNSVMQGQVVSVLTLGGATRCVLVDDPRF